MPPSAFISVFPQAKKLTTVKGILERYLEMYLTEVGPQASKIYFTKGSDQPVCHNLQLFFHFVDDDDNLTIYTVFQWCEP